MFAIIIVVGFCVFAVGIIITWGFLDWWNEFNNNEEDTETEDQKLDDYEKQELEFQSTNATNQNVFINGDNNTVNINSPGTNKVHPTNCVNCGAPLHGDKCPFCDTEYK